jgi:hypothetical protein
LYLFRRPDSLHDLYRIHTPSVFSKIEGKEMDANALKTEPGEAIPLRRLSLTWESEEGSEQSQLLDEDVEFEASEGAWKKALPPQDGGVGAWRVLLGCWLLEISWGESCD